MDRLDIERLGGFAGFGGPGAHLRSVGRLAGCSLSAADRQAVDALFSTPPPAAAGADGFRYRLTRHAASGSQTIEVAEAHVPPAVQAAVRDELV